MIEFQDALKKSRAYNLIKHDIDTGNLSHAYMVISPDVFAVQNLFRLIACAVYCKDACTTCPICKKVLNGNHADVKFINEDGKKIKVEDVAALIEDTETKPFESDNKLYFVNSADKMNPAAQNKLLKTLEEPQKAVSIFLGVGSESAILDTVKSRTKKITLDRFSAGDIKDALISSGVAVGNATIAAACADGMLWRAKEIASNSAFSETFDRAIFILNNLKKSSDVASFLNDKTLDKDNLPVFLDALSIVLRDMIAAKTDKNLIMSKHKEWEIETLSKGFSLDALSNILYLVNEERKKLSFYVGSTGVVENLLLGILEVKYKCQ
jgi:DNA polymerase-3 subunit delta'